MSIFEKRTAFKPFEYPDIVKFKEAINHSYWLVSEWTFLSDLDDFHTRLTPVERSAVKNALLAISQVEVAVKKFWGRLGDRIPKPEFEQVGATFAECFADGTEVLTPTGWVDLAEVVVGDEVLQFNQDGSFSFARVTHKVDREYTGPIHRFHNRNTEILVTPNHRMVCFNKAGEYIVTTAENLSVRNTNLFLPEAGRLVGDGATELSFEERLRVAIQADGNRPTTGRRPRLGDGSGVEYEIRISEPRKVERLDWILSNLPAIGSSKRPIPSHPGMFCYTIGIDAEYNYKEFDWVTLVGKTAEWCEDFIQELAEWDGTRPAGKKVKYSTTNRAAADVAQMVGVGAGYRVHLGTYTDKRKDVYIVSFTCNRERVNLPSLKREVVDYSGWVRCVTVPSGAIITRYNDQTFIAGNCEVRHADAYSHLLEILGLNTDFELLLKIPEMQGRVEYLGESVRSGPTNSDFASTLSLFSLFVENVSLFGQFLVVKSINKHRNLLKDIDNVIQATQQEETIHARFGAFLVNLIKAEHPEWFNDDFVVRVREACLRAYKYEHAIINWIYSGGDLPYLPREDIFTFLQHRFNTSLAMIGIEPLFEVDQARLDKTFWFDEEVLTETRTDFFHKRPVSYSKHNKPVNAEDLF
jgi:ribonucleotide reductase beta subunit family protein with ferritin-like domain